MAKKPTSPLPRYPTGWFQVAYADEIKAGELKSLKYFGEDLIAYRTEAGELRVVDAHCPHMGAHMGAGGCVKGENIECPFHGWQFGTDGKVRLIPYAKRLPPRAKLNHWHAREINGTIMVWHDIEGNPPAWEVPEVPDFANPEFSVPQRKEWTLKTHNQEMAENIVDSAHFKYVHGTSYQPATKIDANDHTIHMISPTIVEVGGNEIPGQIESHSVGFGFSTTRFSGMAETLLMGCVTPIDDEYVHVRFTFCVRKLGGADITKGIGRAFVKEISRQLEQDAPIWEHKIFHRNPILCDGDGPVGLFRKWSKQFYPEWYVKEAHEAYYGSAAE